MTGDEVMVSVYNPHWTNEEMREKKRRGMGKQRIELGWEQIFSILQIMSSTLKQ